MGVEQEWDRIREVMSRGKRSTGHFTIASVDPAGGPHVTPIGTVYLRDDCTGFYFDQYTRALADNLDADPRVCVMAVDSGRLFWLRALVTGRFPAGPGVRLYGTAGPRRPAEPAELDQVRRSVRPALLSRGGRMLWGEFTHVRDLTFTDFRPVCYPVMMSHLWQGVP